jgi:hypothetical protein
MRRSRVLLATGISLAVLAGSASALVLRPPNPALGKQASTRSTHAGYYSTPSLQKAVRQANNSIANAKTVTHLAASYEDQAVTAIWHCVTSCIDGAGTRAPISAAMIRNMNEGCFLADVMAARSAGRPLPSPAQIVSPQVLACGASAAIRDEFLTLEGQKEGLAAPASYVRQVEDHQIAIAHVKGAPQPPNGQSPAQYFRSAGFARFVSGGYTRKAELTRVLAGAEPGSADADARLRVWMTKIMAEYDVVVTSEPNVITTTEVIAATTSLR